MEPNEYQSLANKTAKNFPDGLKLSMVQADLIHAHLGMSSETGEFADAIKKHIIYGQPLDLTNCHEELGDQLWYIMLAMTAAGIDCETIMIQNIDKLRQRYPEKYSDFHAKQRLDKQHGTIQGS